jgi:hypothetical protein
MSSFGYQPTLFLEDEQTSNDVHQYVQADASERRLASILDTVRFKTSSPFLRRNYLGST